MELAFSSKGEVSGKELLSAFVHMAGQFADLTGKKVQPLDNQTQFFVDLIQEQVPQASAAARGSSYPKVVIPKEKFAALSAEQQAAWAGLAAAGRETAEFFAKNKAAAATAQATTVENLIELGDDEKMSRPAQKRVEPEAPQTSAELLLQAIQQDSGREVKAKKAQEQETPAPRSSLQSPLVPVTSPQTPPSPSPKDDKDDKGDPRVESSASGEVDPSLSGDQATTAGVEAGAARGPSVVCGCAEIHSVLPCLCREDI